MECEVAVMTAWERLARRMNSGLREELHAWLR